MGHSRAEYPYHWLSQEQMPEEKQVSLWPDLSALREKASELTLDEVRTYRKLLKPLGEFGSALLDVVSKFKEDKKKWRCLIGIFSRFRRSR